MEDGPEVMCLDSATRFGEVHRGQVVICGSHGGVYCGYLAARAGLRAVVLNDAGGGLDRAGMGCLDYCRELGMAAAVCSHNTARIGDGYDMAVRGLVSSMNEIASALGCTVGMSVAAAANLMRRAPSWATSPAPNREARHVLKADDDLRSVVCLDSVSLVTDADADQIVLTGSHGGLMGGRPEGALRVDAFAAFFNDAGVGMEQAGLGRLAALDRRAIIAGTVDTLSARIGDGLSTYKHGRLSYVNERAASFGLKPGMTAKSAVEQLRQK